MAYLKTTWEDGENKYDIVEQDGTVLYSDIKLVYKGATGTPISSEKMNKAETQYDEAVLYCDDVADEINNIININTYDDYLRTLELYYTGHFTGPGIAGIKGMTFDGFQDTLRVDAVNTDAVVNTSTKKVLCKNATDSWRPTSIVNGANSTGFNDTFDFSLINQMFDENDVSYASTPNYTIGYASVICDLGQTRKINTVRFKGYDGNSSCIGYLKRIAYSNTLSDWVIVDIDDLQLPQNSWAYVERAVSTFEARYIVCEFHQENDIGSLNIADMLFKFNGYEDSTLQSTTKSLVEAINSLMLYISDKRVVGSTITYQVSANNGVNWENLDLLNTRVDPLDATYTEYSYEKSLAYSGDKLIFKAIITTDTGGTVTSEIKRYGIHWA